MPITIHEATERLKASGVRMTTQRQLLLEALYQKLSHPSAEQVYELLYAEHPKVVSLTTVYNNIRALKELGLLREFYIHHSGIARYDTHVEPHHHLICVHCGTIQDYTPAAPLQVEQPDGFSTERAYVELFGTCEDCREANRQGRGVAV